MLAGTGLGISAGKMSGLWSGSPGRCTIRSVPRSRCHPPVRRAGLSGQACHRPARVRRSARASSTAAARLQRLQRLAQARHARVRRLPGLLPLLGGVRAGSPGVGSRCVLADIGCCRAAELYVSVRTVEFHLGNIYDKLAI